MKQRLIDFINNSNLEEADKHSWNALIDASPDLFADSFWEVFSKFPNELNWFNDTLKRKKLAFETMKTDKARGQEMLEVIYTEEIEKLQQLANKEE